MENLLAPERPVRYRTDFAYARMTPTLVTNVLGGHDEIARWILDLNDVLYVDQRHTPPMNLSVVKSLTGEEEVGNSPVLIRTDVLLYSVDSIVAWYEQRTGPDKKLIPSDPAHQKEVTELYRHFTGAYDRHVSNYVYSQLLMERKYAVNWCGNGVPFGEKFQVQWAHGSVKQKIRKEWNLDQHTAGESLTAIKKTIEEMSRLLADGRKYLTGDRLSLADIAFAAVSAPLLLPNEFGGSAGAINKVPETMRLTIEELRATPAGQFILLMYQDERPLPHPQTDVPRESGGLGKWGQEITLALGRRKTSLFYFIQKHFPVLNLGIAGLMTVNKNDLLVEMMGRDNDFTVEEINGKKMANQKGAFFLGMDRNNPQFDRERNFVRSTTKREDLDLIRTFIRDSSNRIVNEMRAYGRIDVADALCYPVLVDFIDHYFGVPPPTVPVMKHWLRVLFYDLFLNFANNKKAHAEAVTASLERRKWILQLIRDRKNDLALGKTLDDNILNRMILLQTQPGNEWFDDETIQRNIGGLITGILETTNKAVILVLDELFNRPEHLSGAIGIAKIQDMRKMYGYVCEAMRFNPAQPGVIRYVEKDQVLTGKGTKKYRIPARRKVFALTACAMMDPAAFPDPKTFKPDRDAVYMNYGTALHECYGKYINAVTISELAAAVLRLPGVRRGDGRAGMGTGLHIGPFFNNFVVAFDPQL